MAIESKMFTLTRFPFATLVSRRGHSGNGRVALQPCLGVARRLALECSPCISHHSMWLVKTPGHGESAAPPEITAAMQAMHSGSFAVYL